MREEVLPTLDRVEALLLSDHTYLQQAVLAVLVLKRQEVLRRMEARLVDM